MSIINSLIGKEPMDEHGRRADQSKFYSIERKIDIKRIIKEMNQEPCELCGKKTSVVGPLFAKDIKDEMGRNCVIMVCSKCLKKKIKSGGK